MSFQLHFVRAGGVWISGYKNLFVLPIVFHVSWKGMLFNFLCKWMSISRWSTDYGWIFSSIKGLWYCGKNCDHNVNGKYILREYTIVVAYPLLYVLRNHSICLANLVVQCTRVTGHINTFNWNVNTYVLPLKYDRQISKSLFSVLDTSFKFTTSLLDWYWSEAST